MRGTSRVLIAAAAVLGLLAAACGDDDDNSSATSASAAASTAASTATSDAVTTTTGSTTTAAASTAPGAATTAPPTTAATAPTTPGAPATITGDIQVLAAASLTDAFNELGTAFTAAYPEAKATFVFQGSNDLATTINEGGPADVFASADQTNMKKVADAGNAAEAPQIFTTNLLAIMTQPGNPNGIKGVADLANSDLIVVTCDPSVPCGTYAQQVFTASGVTVTPKSLEENVKGVVTKVLAGEADAGIVYATDVLAAGDEAGGVAIPRDVNVVAQYPIVTVKQSSNPATAKAFIDFVRSEAGQMILAKYGFSGP